MFGRIFGRGKHDHDPAVCAECGRTLLAGEWTQTIIDEHGDERLICSLCGQAYAGAGEAVAASPTPANNGRVRETRSEAVLDDRAAFAAPPAAEQPFEVLATAAAASARSSAPRPGSRAESDAFWQALKEKDDQIERLRAQLARAEAERQELAARFARLGGAEEQPEPGSLTGDSSEPGERTWGETPAEFAAEMAALRPAGQTEPQPSAPAPAATLAETLVVEAAVTAGEAAGAEPPAAATAGAAAAAATHPAVVEDTQPLPTVGDEMPAAAQAQHDARGGETAPPGGDTLPGEAAPHAGQPAAPSAAEIEAAAASLTLLQRGVDLLNVSRVPRKIAETNEQLGLPHVHVGFDGETVAVTFMWSMGWYRFGIDLENGGVSMDDRGYDELTLQPNAGVRADGTVQLAPAQISRAAAQRAQAAPEPAGPTQPAAAPAEPAAAPVQPTAAPAQSAGGGPETPREAAQKAPEFLSKSLLGQRSDDESASWEQTKARDFDWNR
jgi:hypothetical protein